MISVLGPVQCCLDTLHPAPALHRRRAEPLLPPASVTCAARSPVLLSHANITCTLLVILSDAIQSHQRKGGSYLFFYHSKNLSLCGQLSYQSVMPQQSLWWMRVGSKYKTSRHLPFSISPEASSVSWSTRRGDRLFVVQFSLSPLSSLCLVSAGCDHCSSVRGSVAALSISHDLDPRYNKPPLSPG